MSESTGDKANPTTPANPVSPKPDTWWTDGDYACPGHPPAAGAPVAPAFKFDVGQQVVYRRGEPNQYDAKIHARWIDNEGMERYSFVMCMGSYEMNSGVTASDLSELIPADRTRRGVESLGLGPAEPMEGGVGHRVRGSTGSLEIPGD